MAQDKIKQNDAVKQAQVVDRDEHQKTKESKRLGTYLITVPAAKKKFADISDKINPDPIYNDTSEGPFGLGPLVYPCLQRFNTIECFLTLYFMLTLSHGMLYALVDLSLKILVSQFSASNSETFLMDFSDYFASFLVSMFVAHFGGRGNRAKWVAAASIVTGLSAIAFAVLFFHYEIIKLNIVEEDLCKEGKKTKVCGSTVIPHKSICISLFIFGQCLHGIAGVPIYLLALTFIFDHVPTLSSGLYIGIADAALTVGYFLGYLLGVKSFTLPVEEAMQAVGHVQRFRILQSGWWKSFIFVGSIPFFTTLPLFCFPSNLPGAHKIKLEKSKESSRIDRRLKDKEIKPNLKGVLHVTWCLIRNPLVLTQILCNVTESVTFKASSHYLPLYLQTQFVMTPKSAAMLTGIFILPGCIIGRFLGGYIVDKLQMNIKNKLKFITTASVISIVLFLLLISVKCETAKFPGINDDYDGFGMVGSLKAPCNEKCGCTTSAYNSVCGRDDKQYFSPCFAGCHASKRLRKEKVYYNCSCIKQGLTTVDDEGQYIDAVFGTCNTKCISLPLFFAFFFSATIFSTLCGIPTSIIIMESVPTSWNSVSLGVMFTLWRFIGSVPAPIFFAETSALCCSFWDIDECGIKVRCWIYKGKQLVYTFVGTYVQCSAPST
ncbi:solute carrier organic anion transporter family member 6A1-like isoform X2 [Mus musculus]|uniref:solute carrier organic anion transporter family member 6A1-like isoform X2 n=1 Tax=Mus musculus TaxID=10090 RepID=UPI0005ABA89B|nr:solute carrier organic anion transporter family member 6A1-like isoform X2 [Mus musculus]|eukprot:XP_011246422.1 PREDICTED: solute carrier organic anion transporter family member 6A1-like isoform X2 [Mus musculus]